MKTFTSFLVFLGIFVPEIFAQINVDALYQEYLIAKRRDASYFNRIDGSPYSNQDFSEAVVYFRGNPSPVTGKLRYNELFDEMEMEKDESDEFLIVENKHIIDTIFLSQNEETYRFLIYQDRDNISKGYLLQLVEGNCSLFLKRSREYQPEKKAAAYQDYVPPSIIKKPDLYYMSFGETTPELIPQSAKKIIEFFRQKGYDLTKMNRKQIKYDSTSLIEIARFCNDQ